MEKKVRGIKKFFAEFKTFITRGNVLDMAVGVIVGGAFTAIVNGLSNFVLKPLINWLLAMILGKGGLEGTITMLSPAYTLAEDGTTEIIDLANSIYIDWGSFINAIINFLLIAFTLFVIVRIINNVAAAREKAKLDMIEEANEKRAIKKIRKEQNVSKKEAKRIYEEKVEAAKAAKAEEERLAAEKAAQEEAAAKAAAEEKAMANTRLLEEIRDLLKNRA
nr:large conductance mechanosensitive channel protein MscL [Clostridia bacterium]